ncbi:MAG: LytR family transcriptional regulator [Ruminococcaceae bacterium]|nr:LytR family transcriptional regulator [Oscillospiraceae bacterium]
MKRSLRDYLITLLLAVVIFSAVAVFLIQAAEGLMQDVVVKIGSEHSEETVKKPEEAPNAEPAPEQGEEVEQKDITATFLLLGLDHSKKNADAIFLVGVNATKNQAAVALIPSDTAVVEGKNQYKLGTLYGSRGVNFFKNFIQQETGVLADYYAAMPMSALANLVDILGGISYKVPCAMYHYDPYQNMKINLKAGDQKLSGDQALQMLCYRGYSDGTTGREDTQLGFARAFCVTFLTPANLTRASAILNNLYYNCTTDFDQGDLKDLGEMIFNFSTYSQTYTRIPGAKSGSYYAISTPRAQSMFEVYQ